MTHWFYLYVVWFVPFVLVALLATERRSERTEAASPALTAAASPSRLAEGRLGSTRR